MALMIDSDTVATTPTEDPVLFWVSVDVTEDGKAFTPVRFRYNRNMTKDDLLKVAGLEYRKIQDKVAEPDQRTIVISKLGTAAKTFSRFIMAPVIEEKVIKEDL